ncbi:MAG: NADH:ubiquinone reductase (Na(+)-transporting) subunit A [Bdellovibrionales bacterium RIFOXYB1_FULL_37_110]|nr:MAG: NADH:ubiquinone reductase (Na(+)-transporting) subunit A [Bdellovibrionales bacterium RIFOXYA1_FULL_38_20]OFZ49997.1 MAG: NADH:ubiquinone reductase (Na(+)-transporting) subunit A [Bdellovibrionales bacterium RIFOXYC1_FULL_37_79]OFZ59903.1 MAG: NADH:ubiquinone reductase (Na(+)-transporting) subunit A [Bdellovibrionales bacterium RIFOXYB1_FULL_37_110]OFZ63874.1 MAG: NADH:ubiquinone reductase (Na(+)-transporting) subunit A [Bdellovibrionales bacterium RIFOXYD1_FULL_36_51]
MITIKNGLNLPMAGNPVNLIDESKRSTRLAVMGDDYKGMRPQMLVEVGSRVEVGQKLFEDKKRPGVFITAPGAGEIININRGEKRKFESLLIKLASEEKSVAFKTGLSQSAEEIRKGLVDSGLWTALRTRPYDKTPYIGTSPASIFVKAMDTNPLSFDPEIIIKKYEKNFYEGIGVLTKLTGGKVYVCVKKNSFIKGQDPQVLVKEFSGPHPAGNPGTHIHYLDPVSENKTVWHIDYQDVIAISKLFSEGKLWTTRYVALSGPHALNPRIIKTRLGASIDDLLSGEVKSPSETRVVSGSVLNGTGYFKEKAYLGRFHHQITLLAEGNKRELFGWAMPGLHKFSVTNVFLSKWLLKKHLALNTSINGQHRNIVPVGSYEKVLPGDFLATNLLKSIMAKEIEDSINLGCLELSEEDLALCTYVCPSKSDFGKNLRELLDLIEKEG